MIKNLVYIKIHRCSSTSVRYIIEKYATNNNLLCYKPYTKLNWFRKNDITTTTPTPTQYNVCARHQAYDENFFNTKTTNPHYITFLRDPLSRALSSFYGHDVPPHHTLLTFEEWYLKNHQNLNVVPSVECEGEYLCSVNNFMSYMCGYDNLDEITIETIKNRYTFIGFTETFKKSMGHLEDILGWGSFSHQSLIANKRSANRKITPQEKYNLSPELIDLFKNNNKLDYKLYSLAKQIYQP